MAGLKSGWSEWEESATDSMSQVKSAATQTFDGIAQNMAAMLTGSEQNWRSFTRSVLSMMTEILLKQAMVGIVGSIGSAIGGAVGGGASASGGTAIQAAAAKLHFATGGFTGTGGKYKPAGIVHRGEFVFTKEATSRIGVGNLLPADARLCHRRLCRYTGAVWHTSGRQSVPGRLSRITMW